MLLTQEQKSLIAKSWDYLVDPVQNMLVFYKRLFDEYPETKVHFARVDMTKMSQKLADTIHTLVAHVDNPENLRTVLEQLGRSHRNLGIEPPEYVFVKDALLHTLKDALGPLYTEAIGQAWDTYISFAAAIMINAPQTSATNESSFMRLLRRLRVV